MAKSSAKKTAAEPEARQKAGGGKPVPNGSPARSATIDLLYQVLETELGGVKVYQTALRCALNPDLRTEWQKYLAETRRHVDIARTLLESFGLDPEREVPARVPVRTIGQSLVFAMEQGLASGDPVAAQLTAADCVVEAETKDHQNWELVGRLAKASTGTAGDLLLAAYEAVEDEEDHHVYHSAGWARELWIEALGLPAVLPPPEEAQDVDNAREAAEAMNSRDAAV